MCCLSEPTVFIHKIGIHQLMKDYYTRTIVGFTPIHTIHHTYHTYIHTHTHNNNNNNNNK